MEKIRSAAVRIMRTFTAILYKGPAHGKVVKDIAEGTRTIIIPMAKFRGQFFGPINQVHYDITEHVVSGKRIFELVKEKK